MGGGGLCACELKVRGHVSLQNAEGAYGLWEIKRTQQAVAALHGKQT